MATGVSNPSKDGSEAAKIVPLADVQEGHCIFVGQTLYLTTKDKHPGKPIDPKKLKWSCSGPGGEEGFHHDGEDANLTAGEQGTYTVTAECQGFSASFTATACGLSVKEITFVDSVDFFTAPGVDSTGGDPPRTSQYKRGMKSVLVCLAGGEGVKANVAFEVEGVPEGARGPTSEPAVVGKCTIVGKECSLDCGELSLAGTTVSGAFSTVGDSVPKAVAYVPEFAIKWSVNGRESGTTSTNPLATLYGRPVTEPPDNDLHFNPDDVEPTGKRIELIAGTCGAGLDDPDGIIKAFWGKASTIPVRPKHRVWSCWELFNPDGTPAGDGGPCIDVAALMCAWAMIAGVPIAKRGRGWPRLPTLRRWGGLQHGRPSTGNSRLWRQ